mmetsp:Transcript_42736/g.75690  ORF Transcript_42736/g.75690 Transcript_42736/m.75690 type:complete len:82 (+) Transcript_42736:1577-1822(+)
MRLPAAKRCSSSFVDLFAEGIRINRRVLDSGFADRHRVTLYQRRLHCLEKEVKCQYVPTSASRHGEKSERESVCCSKGSMH